MIRATVLRVSRAIPLILLAVVFLTHCHHPKPSAEFAKAHDLFARLYGAKLDEAYADPQMRQVEDWLEQVPPDSLDFADAQALLTRIREGRKRLAEQEAKLKSTVDRLTSSEAYGRMSESRRAIDGGQKAKEVEPEVPVAGMTMEEFDRRFSRCFTPWESVTLYEQGVAKGKANSWQLKDIANCRDLYPGFAQKLVLGDERKVIATVDKSSIERRPVDAGVLGGDR